MENIKVGYIPVGQAVKIDNKKVKIKTFLKKNKIGLIIGGASIALFSIYAVLIINFINVIKSVY